MMIMDWAQTETGSANLAIAPLRDQPYNNAKWMQSVQESVDAAIIEQGWAANEYEVVLTGSDRDETTWYLGAFPQFKGDLKAAVPPGEDLSATRLRDRLFDCTRPQAWADVPETTWKFIEQFKKTGIFNDLQAEYRFIKKYREQFAQMKYEPTFVTADAVVIQSGHVLVVKRGALPGRGLWALPGGFVKSKQTVQQAAITEVVEETGIRLADGKKAEEITKQILAGSIKAKEIFDDPNRSLRGRTITTAFLIRLDDTKPLPKVKGQFAPLEDTGGVEGVVETADAFWLPIADARATSQNWFEDHHAILDTMLGMIKD
jgi:bifunctional NMN adenylyltransferase/nudix hydrolase